MFLDSTLSIELIDNDSTLFKKLLYQSTLLRSLAMNWTDTHPDLLHLKKINVS